jgi:hypothetical protein
VSTIEPRKNLVRLLERFRFGVSAAHPRGERLVLAGTARMEMRGDLRPRPMRRTWRDRVVFLDYVAGRVAAGPLLPMPSRALYPSLFEGFGFPVVEAMSLRRPRC